MGDHWQAQQQQLHALVVRMEKANNAEPVTSLQTAKIVEHAPSLIIASGIQVQARLLFKMAMTIMV